MSVCRDPTNPWHLVCSVTGMGNVERTTTDMDVLEHVLEGVRLSRADDVDGEVVAVDYSLHPWLAGETESTVEVRRLPDEFVALEK